METPRRGRSVMSEKLLRACFIFPLLVAACETATCPPNWKLFGISCYYFGTNRVKWTEAMAYCQEHGGNLAKDLREVHGFLTAETEKLNTSACVPLFTCNPFIGLVYRPGEGYQWSDGTVLDKTFMPWSPNEGKGGDSVRITVLTLTDIEWNDFRLSLDPKRWYICEKIASAMRPIFYNITQVLNEQEINKTKFLDIIDEVIHTASNLMNSSVDSTTLVPDVLAVVEKLVNICKIVDQTEERFTLNETLPVVDAILKLSYSLGMFALQTTEPGSGPITINSTSIVLRVERDIARNLCNSTIRLGEQSGFEIPAADNLSLNSTSNEYYNLIAFKFKNNITRAAIEQAGLTQDILTLSIFDDFGKNVKVMNMEEYLRVWLSRQSGLPDNKTTLSGEYDTQENVTYYSWEIKDVHLNDAMQIELRSTEDTMKNATVRLYRLPRPTSLEDYDFATSLSTVGNVGHIFIPGSTVTRTQYYVLLIFSHDISKHMNFTISVTRHTCLSLDFSSIEWQRRECEVSPMSNINSTLCLCDYL